MTNSGYLYILVFKGTGRIFQISIFQAAMPPMVMGGILAIEHKLDVPLVNMMLGIGIPLGFLTLPIWSYFLQRL